MPTPPLPDAVLTKMRAGYQAVRWKAILGNVVQFYAHCCNIDSDSIFGVSKQPVVVLDLSSNPVCLGDAIDFDFAGSYAPGSTVTAYDIDMDDGTSYTLIPPATSGSHTYLNTGTYTVHAAVTEGLGKQTTMEYQVEVIDCDDGLLIAFCYVGMDDGGGVYFMDFSDSPPTWDARNQGLIGSALNVNALALRPGHKRLKDTVHELYACTDGGLHRTFNGGRSWEQIPLPDPSNAEFADVPPAVVGDLIFYDCVYSRVNSSGVYVLAGSAKPRLWIYHTSDGLNWVSRGLKV